MLRSNSSSYSKHSCIFFKKQMKLGVFLDLEKDFDMVWRERIIEKLSELVSSGKCNDFLQDRSMEVKVGETLSYPQTLDNGTPQGSVLSPLWFIVMLADLNLTLPS